MGFCSRVAELEIAFSTAVAEAGIGVRHSQAFYHCFLLTNHD